MAAVCLKLDGVANLTIRGSDLQKDTVEASCYNSYYIAGDA